MRRVGFVALVALVVGLWWLAPGPPRAAAPQFITHTVDRGPIASVVTATGTVNPVGAVEVGTYVSGPVQAVHVDFNSPIAKGQVLAKIDPRPFQVKVDGAAAALANAEARLAKAHADAALKAATVRRHRSLRADGVVAASELDIAESEHRQAVAQVALDRAEIQAAQARLDEAQVNLAYTDIVAPIDGMVVSRSVSVGQTVTATFQTPVLFVVAGDLAHMRLAASVSESDVGGVADAQPVTFTVDAFPSSAFTGRVRQVRSAPITVQNVVTYDVLIDVDNADLRLKPGMTANVAITTAQRDDAVRIPPTALRFRPPVAGTDGAAAAAPASGSTVWRLGADGEPEAVAVTAGITGERFTEITSGLAAGDRVLVGVVAADDPGAPTSGPSLPSGMRRRAH